jgi:hypothetical protein
MARHVAGTAVRCTQQTNGSMSPACWSHGSLANTLINRRIRALAYGTTIPVQVGTGLPGPACVDEKVPRLMGNVGSVRLPSTTNALERFCRGFERFDNTRKGFHSVLSATRELLLFLVVYVFTQHATTGQAPIEVIMPEARRMPLYRLINDPFRALQERASVKPEAHMAELLLPKAAGA